MLERAAFACKRDEEAHYYVYQHAWGKDGKLLENYTPRDYLLGFQRVKILIQSMVDSSDLDFAPLLQGKTKISINLLLDFMNTYELLYQPQPLHI